MKHMIISVIIIIIIISCSSSKEIKVKYLDLVFKIPRSRKPYS